MRVSVGRELLIVFDGVVLVFIIGCDILCFNCYVNYVICRISWIEVNFWCKFLNSISKWLISIVVGEFKIVWDCD